MSCSTVAVLYKKKQFKQEQTAGKQKLLWFHIVLKLIPLILLIPFLKTVRAMVRGENRRQGGLKSGGPGFKFRSDHLLLLLL